MVHKDLEEYKELLPQKVLKELEETCSAGKLKKAAQKVYEEYCNSAIAAGESVGLISAESIGEPGTQMSVAKDEKVIVKVNNKVKIVKIGEFIDEVIKLKGSLKINAHSEVTPLNDLEVFVPSLNNDEKTEWKRAIECSKHKPIKNLIKLTTASGRQITSTDNHSFVTRKNNKIVSIKGSDLKIGDRLPVINNFFVQKSLDEVKINDYVIDESLSVNSENDFLNKSATKSVKNTIQLNQLTGLFIGSYLSEGYANTGSVGISNIDEGFIQNAKNFATTIGLDFFDDIRNGEFGPSRTLLVRSSILGKFVINSCGRLSDFKRVPDFAFNASDEFVSGLLRAYFDGDGNFHVSRKMIRASSNSKELIDGIALLLSRFKIFSFKTSDKKGQHWLLIPYKYAPLFLARIGSEIDYKREALEELASQAKKFWNEKSQDYTDMISGFGNLFYDTAKKLGIPTRYVNNFTKRQKIGRTALYRYIKTFENVANKKNIDISKKLEIMNKMFNSDIVWDEITSIKEVKDYDDFVYDFSVPGLETFTTFEGIITHNTLNTFHFAGVAEMNVTMGLPRIIEILDARKTISTPMMEIYLKSPYNKGKDIRELALSIKETKMEAFIKEFIIDIANLKIEITINQNALKEHSTTLNSITKGLEKNLGKEAGVKVDENKIEVRPKSKEEKNLNTLYKLKEKIKESYVKGVKGITQVLPVKRKEEFIILTAGTNMKKILELDFVDSTKTTTNDIFEIEKTFGIEAARQAIIDEVFKVIETQGLNVDIRHIMLAADTMCASGKIKGITRYGVVSEKASVLARASFETPIKHIIDAAITGEVDTLNSVIENVMLNQLIPLGTGLPRLVTKGKNK